MLLPRVQCWLAGLRARDSVLGNDVITDGGCFDSGPSPFGHKQAVKIPNTLTFRRPVSRTKAALARKAIAGEEAAYQFDVARLRPQTRQSEQFLLELEISCQFPSRPIS